MATAASRAVSRNDPCPCGSGKRFKDCHGSLRSNERPATPLPAAPQSRYRPAGDDWSALPESERDRLGALMETALKHQVDERARDAERAYRAVLEQAPHTHDALHMLGVVRLGLGDFTEAERLIRAAMALRAPYPAIEKNWALVQRSIASRDRRGVEILAEHALPLLFESLYPAHATASTLPRTGPTRDPLHVVGAAGHVADDENRFGSRLAQLLAPLKPVFWHVDEQGDACAWQAFDRHALDPSKGLQPLAGDVVLTSVECDTDAWLRESIGRVLVFARAATPVQYLDRLRRLAADGARRVSVVFHSRAQARRFGLADYVVPPPIDLSAYPDVRAPRDRSASTLRVAAVGQDGRRVTAATDAELLKTIATRAGAMSLFDPGPLRYDVGMDSLISCVARDERPLPDVLAQADVYLHRVRPWWTEDASDAVFDALALGVPVLCHRDSIHAEHIDDGVDGWLYGDDADAIALVDALRADPSRRTAAGAAARAKAQRLFEPRALAQAYVDAIGRWRARA